WAIVWQPSIRAWQETDEVKQRRDIRVSLTVVVAEETLVVTNQTRVHVRTNKLPVVRESLGSSEFQRTIITARGTKALSNALWRRETGKSVSLALTCVEQEIILAIIERTIFNYVVLISINASGSKNEILGHLVLDTG